MISGGDTFDAPNRNCKLNARLSCPAQTRLIIFAPQVPSPVAPSGKMRNMARKPKLVSILEQNWQAEMEGFHTYGALAAREPDRGRSTILHAMAQAEQQHAEMWAGRLTALGQPLPRYTGRKDGEAGSLLNRIGGPEMLLRRLEIEESRDIARYARQLRELNDPDSTSILEQVLQDEEQHYRELSRLLTGRVAAPSHAITAGSATQDPKPLLEQLLAKRSKSGRQAAGWIGDAIYGVNDGLGAIFGIVSGVSGATLGNQRFVLLAGIAGMIASALSMGTGAYLAAKSEREIYEAEVAREKEAIATNRAEANELLSLYYQVKGLPAEDADRVVSHIAKDPEQMLRALAAERLNSTEEALRNPITSAWSGAFSTALGAFIPIIPFFFVGGYTAVVWAAAISLAAHFAVGASKSLITVRSWWSSGFEMTLVGALEGVVTFVIGIGLGHLGT
jgi:predicted membrane protein (TIGR00267 family)